jgi:hypothetical protein
MKLERGLPKGRASLQPAVCKSGGTEQMAGDKIVTVNKVGLRSPNKPANAELCQRIFANGCGDLGVFE